MWNDYEANDLSQPQRVWLEIKRQIINHENEDITLMFPYYFVETEISALIILWQRDLVRYIDQACRVWDAPLQPGQTLGFYKVTPRIERQVYYHIPERYSWPMYLNIAE